MISITRKFTFDAGHRVLGHKGKCRHPHGHRYVAEVSVVAPQLDDLGMVIDFSVIKEKVGGWIDRHWDHNFIVHAKDPFLALSTEEQERMFGRDLYVMPDCNPTAENLAKELFDVAHALLYADKIRVCHVRIWETENCYADYAR